MNLLLPRRILAFIAAICLIALLLQALPTRATPIVNRLSAAPDRSTVQQNPDFSRHFHALGIEGAIIIYDASRDRTYQHNPQRNATAFLPASTFKILNALIALETGVIANELAVLTWDGVSRSVPAWNRDLNLKEAFRLSAVWFYQVLARRVGHERMQQWVRRVGYGNQTIGRPADIDQFWPQGDLRITPQAQIQFLRHFYQADLPFSLRSSAIVKDMMIMEQTPAYTIRGKTGWVRFGDNSKPQVGWYVGYIEQGQQVYFFATNIDIRHPQDATARLDLTRQCFKDLGVL